MTKPKKILTYEERQKDPRLKSSDPKDPYGKSVAYAEFEQLRERRIFKSPVFVKNIDEAELIQRTELTNFIEYQTRFPVRDEQTRLHLKIRFIKYKGGRIVQQHTADGWSKIRRVNRMTEENYARFFRQAFNSAMFYALQGGMNFTPDDFLVIEEDYIYYTPLKQRFVDEYA